MVTKKESIPHVVTLDAVLNPHEPTTYQPIIKRVPEKEVVKWTFEQLIEYMLSGEPDEYNVESLTLAEQNLALRIEGILEMCEHDSNVTYQIFVPDTGDGITGPFSPTQKVGGTVDFSRDTEQLPSGVYQEYSSLKLRVALYDIGG